MRNGGLVFTTPKRYFADMLGACTRLAGYYASLDAGIRPLFAATMKRDYLFENSLEQYGEFEKGEQFLFFSGCPEALSPARLFRSTFPTLEILMEAKWEGVEFQVNIVPVDDSLFLTLQQKFEGIDWSRSRSENAWVLVESYGRLLEGRYGIAGSV